MSAAGAGLQPAAGRPWHHQHLAQAAAGPTPGSCRQQLPAAGAASREGGRAGDDGE